ncbi:DUF1120 domain-containing protein [Dyella sp. 20L07]|uniref:DUF1120 domain-containing protein n=1 Tax=Dyella sp. 20L07 TaxID=3384240 RepID=UPI003D27665C
MNTRIFKLAIMSAILMGATAAHATAPTSELVVKGALAVPGCTVSAANDGVYDFGRISASLIKAGTAVTTLPPISQAWTVTCDAQTFLAFNVVDNRASSASAAAANNFGLGNVNGTGKLGFYTVTLSSPTVDGKTVSTYSTANTSFTAATTAILNSGQKHGWATASNNQASGLVFGANLQVAPTLGGTTTMGGPVTDEVPLDGSLTLNFMFGL